jgi:hypothetical protein
VRVFSQPQALATEEVTGRVRFAVVHILRDDETARMGELQHLDPAVEERPRARCDDSPWRIDCLEAGKEISRAGDLDRIFAKVLGNQTFLVVDVCKGG